MAQTTIYASIDSKMQGVPEGFQHLNFGGADEIRVAVIYLGGSKTTLERPIANFDVSALTGATINTAKLQRQLSQLAGGGAGAEISRCTRPATWVEPQVDWVHFDHAAGDPGKWTIAGGDIDATTPPTLSYMEPFSTGLHEVFGLGDFVIDALANRSGIVSIIMRLENEDPGTTHVYGWYTSERNPSTDGWRLVIDYTPAGGPAAQPLDLRSEDGATVERMSGRSAARPVPATSPRRARPPVRPQRGGPP